MARRRNIAVVTGSRAEFGLLQTVMSAVSTNSQLVLNTVVGGLHLTSGTWKDVKAAGFAIDARVSMQRKNESGFSADVQAVARGVKGFGNAFDKLKPDAVVVLGDRIEAFAAATAASIGGFRVAHIHGGDRAEGVADEAMRHAISKMAHLHFPATAQSQKRLIRMGEPADRVINVGSSAIDVLRSIERPKSRSGLLAMLHPTGASDREESTWMENVIKAIRKVPSVEATCFFNPNADPGSTGIHRTLDRFVPAIPKQGDRQVAEQRIVHLPRDEFLRQLASSRAIVGNSSAGLIEAAALKVPCVNIGPRQNGREKPANVIDCDYDVGSITKAIRKALKSDLRRMRHPYGDGCTGKRIADYLANVEFNQVPIRKQNTY